MPNKIPLLPSLLLLFLTLSFGVITNASSKDKEETYSQPYSTRYYYEKAKPKLVAPFQRVQVNAPPKNIISNKLNTFLLTNDFKVEILKPNGTVVDTGISSPDCSIAPSTDGFVLCTTSLCKWYTCNKDSLCTTDTSVTHQLGTIVAIATDLFDDSVWLAGVDSSLLRIFKKGGIQSITSIAGNVTTIEVDSRRIAVGTTLAVYYNFNGTKFTSWVNAYGASMDGFPTALAYLGEELWIGGNWCLNVIRKDGYTVDRVSGTQGLPFGNITYLRSTQTELWIGTTHGLARMDLGIGDGPYSQWRFFAGDRWLPGNNNVSSLSASSASRLNGSTVWVATDFGLASISILQHRLSKKVEMYTETATTIMSRHGWVAAADLDKYGDITSLSLHAGDNDGLWTGMLVSGLIYQYAVTKSKIARDLAWKHYAAVEFLHNVTNTHGFIARTAVMCNESHGGGDSGICPKGSPITCGWVNSAECYDGVDVDKSNCCWTWKRDTSSDEVTGHFFTMLQAWMFLAENQSEKDRVAEKLCNTAEYLLDGNLRFIDPISKKGTSWGYWDPEQLNGVPGKPNERGENSLEVLGFLAAATRVCGTNNTHFADTFASLVRDHQYDINVVNAMATSPQSLAFFDFRLAFMSFHTLAIALPDLMLANGTGYDPLIPLTKEEQLLFRSRMQQSVKRYWNDKSTGGTVNAENNWDAGMSLMYQRIIGEKGMSDPKWQLKRYPTELTLWPNVNSKRWDVTLLKDWLIYPNNQLVVEEALPADEAFGWSDDMTEGANCGVDLLSSSTRYQAPSPFILIYWMQEYYEGI